jgi:hypothetical protein
MDSAGGTIQMELRRHLLIEAGHRPKIEGLAASLIIQSTGHVDIRQESIRLPTLQTALFRGVSRPRALSRGRGRAMDRDYVTKDQAKMIHTKIQPSLDMKRSRFHQWRLI